jgi:predicted small metal-binding protein
VVASCQGQTEDDVLAEAAKHGKEVHGMTDADFDEQTVERVRASIHNVP